MKELYSQIHIPFAVYQEIEAGKNKGYYQELTKIDWIIISKVKDEQAVKYFLDLDAGEAEAIVLASETNADLIILDEKLGWFHAKHAGLNVTNYRSFDKSKKNGLIKELKPLLTELTQKNVWISDKLKWETLKQVDEE